MPPYLGLFVVTWVALALLYLGLARVLQELYVLRARVASLSTSSARTGGASQLQFDLALPSELAAASSVVVAAESSCSTCWKVLTAVAAHPAPSKPLLLTYEDERVWEPVADDFTVIRSHSGWSSISHLTPPVLVKLGPQGRPEQIVLPVSAAEVTSTLDSWAGQKEAKGSGN